MEEPIRSYRVSYRIVANSSPRMSVVFTYYVSDRFPWRAEAKASNQLDEDVRRLFGVYDNEWLKRVTVSRIK